MPMQTSGLDSRKRLRTKLCRGIDLTTAGVAADATQTLFLPPRGTKWFVKGVISHVRKVAGTVSDAPNIVIDNGTNGNDIVAAVDLSTTEGAVKNHTIASTTLFIDHDKPLRLKSADAADGATQFAVDLSVELVQIEL